MGGWTCILTNKPNGVLYIGVTSDLAARIMQHRAGTGRLARLGAVFLCFAPRR